MSHIIHLTADTRNLEILKSLSSEDDKISVEAIPEYLTDGPLQDEDIKDFDSIRSSYRQRITTQQTIFKEDNQEGSVALMMRISTQLSNHDAYSIIYWMGANAIDVIGYFFTLHYLQKHASKIKVINIAGLPFINEDVKLIFPTHIFQLPTNQLQKALRLSRPLSPAEIEVDGEEWKSIRNANASIRTLDGNKKISNQTIAYFDSQLLNAHKEGGKISRTAQNLFHKNLISLNPLFIEHRLANLLEVKASPNSSDINEVITPE